MFTLPLSSAVVVVSRVVLVAGVVVVVVVVSSSTLGTELLHPSIVQTHSKNVSVNDPVDVQALRSIFGIHSRITVRTFVVV